MKERELRQHTKCALCERNTFATGLPLFWTVRIQRFGLKADAVRRQVGLEQMIGNVALAQVFSPNEDMATPMHPPIELTVCEDCACNRYLPLAALAEMAEEDDANG
jgi:hypothetical protein